MNGADSSQFYVCCFTCVHDMLVQITREFSKIISCYLGDIFNSILMSMMFKFEGKACDICPLCVYHYCFHFVMVHLKFAACHPGTVYVGIIAIHGVTLDNYQIHIQREVEFLRCK